MLFYGCLVATVLAGLVAAAADTQTPSKIALGSQWLQRLEVGGLTFLILYLLGVVLFFAYHGKAVPEVELAGGGVTMPDAGDLNAAAQDIDMLVADQEQRYELLRTAIERMNERLTRLEERADG